MIRKLKLLIVASAVPCAIGYAQTPIDTTEEVVLQADQRTGESDDVLDLIDFNQSGDTGQAAVRQQETVTIDFPDEEIRAVLRTVADLYELNLVIPQELQGRTSVKLRDVTWEQVFKVVLSPVGYTYVKEDNIIKVISSEQLAMEPTETQVFIIDYARAENIKGTIDPLVSPEVGGRVNVDVRSNALVITERPSKMERIKAIIDRLDTPTDQIMIESKFVEATNTDIKNIGVNWSSLNGLGLQMGPSTRTWNKSDGNASDYTGSNGVTSGSNNSSTYTNTTGSTGTTSSSSGYSMQDGVRTDSPTAYTSTNGTSSNIGDNIVNSVTSGVTNSLVNGITGATSQGRISSTVFSADAFKVVLSALKSNTDVKLVSNPTVVTMDNTEATINIGEDYPIPAFTYNEERGTFEISDIEYKSIGINLTVTPQVNSAGFINLMIAPEVSARAGSVPLGGASGTEVPIISSRKTKTNITIKDGYTLAIGGLIETTETNEVSKVPLLGDIPGLGRLFRSNGDNLQQRNLIIFITAKTLNPDGSDYREVIDARLLHEMGITEKDVPGYELTDKEKEIYQAIEDYRTRIDGLEEQMRLESALGVLHDKEAQTQADKETAEMTGEKPNKKPFILERR